ncbi:MAG: hydroxysqualene dehydroxylase HpnE [Dehalococcoidia bacterium]|jgi:squalene-associated FAD-dependent desaturase|nr:hydroxysqualene dehydroxylase HpnE [Dehalococcoidia bacterium]
MATRSVVIIGGGIAGLAAAVHLVRLGLRPIVLEKRPFLGGRAYSFTDRETGMEIDNGQHVFVGACDQFQQFVSEIGAVEQIRLDDRLRIPVLKQGRLGWLKARKLPGPLANLSALLGYRHVGLAGKMRILWGLLGIRLTRLRAGSAHDSVTFEDWLRDHGQNDETIENFWNLIILPSLNDDISVVSAHTGIMLFKVALLGPARNPAMGIPLAGLSKLTGDNARNYVEEHGGEIRTGVDVTSLKIDDAKITGVITADGELFEGEAVISAVPAAALKPLLPGEPRGPDTPDDFFTPAESVKTAPIVAVHIWYDRPVMSEKFVAVLDSPLQWVFNDTDLKARDDNGGQHIVVSLSGAWEWKDFSKQELRETFTAEMELTFPEARTTGITRFAVVKTLEATFRSRPGSQRFRLSQRTPLPGFYLAGDWTATGWPSTMESAVRSGNLAAEYIVADIGTGGP